MKHRPKLLSLVILLALIALPMNFCCVSLFSGPKPSPPAQPAEGPGSSDYAHADFTMELLGEGTSAAYLFEPADPQPSSAPVVAFMHGFGGVNPNVYAGWIKHLLFKGYIVIFPVYQDGGFDDDTTEFMADAITGLQTALAELEGEGHVAPELDKFAFVGHSLGCVLSANLASVASENDLPTPRAIFLATPGDVGKAGLLDSLMEGMDYSNINENVLMLAVLGGSDDVVDPADTVAIIEGATSIPAGNKQIIEHFSDDTGEPELVADHFAPNSYENAFGTGEVMSLFGVVDPLLATNAIDFYGYWKWSEALLNAAFEGTNRQYALGGTLQQLDMGMWSDGTQVRLAEVYVP